MGAAGIIYLFPQKRELLLGHRSSIRPSSSLSTYLVETGLYALQATPSLGREDPKG